MPDLILIPVFEEKVARPKIALDGDATIEQSAIWNHCFDSLPANYKWGVWIKANQASRARCRSQYVVLRSRDLDRLACKAN